jgi:pimeloyl-ACP methyl ester carboxylesterase
MRSAEVAVPSLDGAALMRAPDQGVPLRGGVVALHGAALPQREQPLFEHLARTLTPLGYAVLSYDRRAAAGGDDVPLDVQAEDALAGLAALQGEIDAHVGVFGFSQGAWAAALAASRSAEVAFLALVGSCGVSPAIQMRYYTDELLRRAGYGEDDRAQLHTLRLAVEDVLRGKGDRVQTANLLAAAATRPWFPMAYLPPELPPPEEGWHDMDYDPEPTFSAVTCPALLMYGADEECVPAAPSKAAWLRAARVTSNSDLTIVDLPGCGHFPVIGDPPTDLQPSISDISPVYTAALESWFASRPD